MPDYKEVVAEGKSWVRSHHVSLDNQLGGIPTAQFHEEQVVELNGEVFKKPYALAVSYPLHATLTNPANTFPRRNPITDEIIEGEPYTDADLHQIAYSKYRAEAIARDARVAADAAAAEAARAAAEQSQPT